WTSARIAPLNRWALKVGTARCAVRLRPRPEGIVLSATAWTGTSQRDVPTWLRFMGGGRVRRCVCIQDSTLLDPLPTHSSRERDESTASRRFERLCLDYNGLRRI